LIDSSYLSLGKADIVAEQIKGNGGKAISVPGDVTDPNFAKKLVDETIK